VARLLFLALAPSAGSAFAQTGVIDTLTIPNDRPVKVTGNVALERGRWYVLEASGAVSDWSDHKSDHRGSALPYNPKEFAAFIEDALIQDLTPNESRDLATAWRGGSHVRAQVANSRYKNS